jgi:hypothetical protein
MNIKELLVRGRETIAEHCPINNYTSQSWRPSQSVRMLKEHFVEREALYILAVTQLYKVVLKIYSRSLGTKQYPSEFPLIQQ